VTLSSTPYRAAIDHTVATINRRARYFRNLIVTVVAIALASLAWAAFARSLSPLCGLLLLVPTCGLFFVLDARLLDHWRSRLLESWVKKDIDFTALFGAVNAIPKLPQDTLRTMLGTLPKAGDLVSEQAVSSSTREGIAAVVAALNRCQSDLVAWKAAASAVVAMSVVIAVGRRAWSPLLGGLSVIWLPFLGKWFERRRIAVCRRRVLAARSAPDFGSEKYRQLLASLPEHSILKLELEDLLKG
jgi:hypothetical protein